MGTSNEDDMRERQATGAAEALRFQNLYTASGETNSIVFISGCLACDNGGFTS